MDLFLSYESYLDFYLKVLQTQSEFSKLNSEISKLDSDLNNLTLDFLKLNLKYIFFNLKFSEGNYRSKHWSVIAVTLA